jgi:hypothetical protein
VLAPFLTSLYLEKSKCHKKSANIRQFYKEHKEKTHQDWLKNKCPTKRKQPTPFLIPMVLLFLLCTSDQQKIINFLEDHPIDIPTNFDSNWSSGFREED